MLLVSRISKICCTVMGDVPCLFFCCQFPIQTDFSQLKKKKSKQAGQKYVNGGLLYLREYSKVGKQVIDYTVHVLHIVGENGEAQLAVQFRELAPVH